MAEYKVISSREEAIKVWDRDKVIIREDDGYYFVYPLIGRGYKYPGFDLRRECCLNTFITLDKAKQWVTEAGYSYTLLK